MKDSKEGSQVGSYDGEGFELGDESGYESTSAPPVPLDSVDVLRSH